LCTFDFYTDLMSKPVRIFLGISGALLGLLVILILGFLIFTTATEFSPDLKSKVEISGKGKSMDPGRREFTLFSWNIGYAGLGKEMDFFYDGGKKTRPGRTQCLEYFREIQEVIRANDSADFMFIQEIDVYSKRAWYQDEYAGLSSLLSGHFHGFSPNYNCWFIPVPFLDPMGKVKAGLATFSIFRPDDATVQYYGSDFPWPTRLAMLKRCYILFRFRLDNGKDLVIVNLHNSAYDSTGLLRERELFVLDSVFTSEYNRGNYIIGGGDWNSNPRGFHPEAIRQGDLLTTIDPPISDTFLPGWAFVFDSLNPSNRFTDIPYQKGVTRTTIIDFFVISPNVEISHIGIIPLEFKYSDHEPVMVKIRLK